MKTAFLILMILATINFCFGQETNSKKSYQDYKREGNLEMIIGSALLVGSALIFVHAAQGNVPMNNIRNLVVGGALILGASIVVLSSSGKSFKKARELSANLDYKPMEIQRFSSRQMAGVPVVSIRIKF
ncbi:hypothetical protein [Algoriphagus sp.]|uniref:hypothetical protein n=1 Tax=Algoriphagus sp. TaxID=1872435 RepID=UPI00271930D0|nr:hypothetical protein [Algoriphagus sp.]MDO8966616.1 hypothetical protein [Algoriphagus sp.]MDP3202062.1 hypothetical protein [Algoriphagus sp.]